MKLNRTILPCLLLAASITPVRLQANWPSLATVATFLEKNVVPATKIAITLASVGYAGYLAWRNRHTIEDWAHTHHRPEQPAPVAQQTLIEDLIQRNTQLTQESADQQQILSRIQQIRSCAVALARENQQLRMQLEQLRQNRDTERQSLAQATATSSK